MNDIKIMFENWRMFLEGSLINEGPSEEMSDSTIESDRVKGNRFVDFFSKSLDTAQLALKMIESSIEDYEKLKSVSMNSEEYGELAGPIISNASNSVDDEILDKYIESLHEIRDSLIQEIERLR